MKGVAEVLVVYEDKVTITPKGVLGLMPIGLKGTKTIPFGSITGIQFKDAGTLFSGYIQFTIPGGNESKGGFLLQLAMKIHSCSLRKKQRACHLD